MNHLFLTYDLLTVFARGGGGGSGGGGGGGGFEVIIAVLGFFPTYYFARFVGRRMDNLLGYTIIAAGTIAYSSFWFFFGWFGILIALAALVGGPCGYFELMEAVSKHVRKKAKKDISAAATKDTAWDEATLTQTVQNIFFAFQNDWSTGNAQNFTAYMTPGYAYHNQLIIFALQLRNRQNIMGNIQIKEIYPSSVTDSTDNTQDRVTYYIKAQAQDTLLEKVNGRDEQLFVDNSEFEEFWNFVRTPANTWALERIDQTSDVYDEQSKKIEDFAKSHNMYFSVDWGWLLLPRRGRLFQDGVFGTSNINNHVVGVYNNLLIEQYTYLEDAQKDDDEQKKYTIAQVALPKYYGSIIVESRDSKLREAIRRAPSGYNELTLEWPDFNNRYRIYATDVEQVTAFELLHPVFMEKLFALSFKLNIEVVDNVVYLYTTDENASYEVMHSILQDAFKEMRL